HGQQSCFSLRRGHTGQRSDLRVRQFASGERLGHERQRAECVRDPDPLSRGTQVEPYPPGEPLCARAEARVPTRPRVELADQVEKPRGRGVEVRRQLGDLVAQPVELCNTIVRRSEERRVGKECRSRWSPEQQKKNGYSETTGGVRTAEDRM